MALDPSPFDCHARFRSLFQAALLVVAIGISAFALNASIAAAAGTVGWNVRAVAEPSRFSPNDALGCQGGDERKCDRYQILLFNAGDIASSGPITLIDTLPPGLTTVNEPPSGQGWSCTEGAGQSIVTCTSEEPVPPGHYAGVIRLKVTPPGPTSAGKVTNRVVVEGGGAEVGASVNTETPISVAPPPFEASSFEFEANRAGGTPELQAGAHPWAVNAHFEVPLIPSPPEAGQNFVPFHTLKSATVELPPGLYGNPQVTSHCTQTQLRLERCPADSEVGVLALGAGQFAEGGYALPGSENLSPIFNMVPEGGYPAEFAFTFASVPVFLYANVLRGPSGYVLRIGSTGITNALEIHGAVFTFFGQPGKFNGSGSEAAFLSNPVNCSSGPLLSRLELEAWAEPGNRVSAERSPYPGLEGCGGLRFAPSLTLQPTVTTSDSPAGLDVDLAIPQTSDFEELATPELKSASVALPEGLVVSPSAANGLQGCDPVGPEGINLGSANVGPEGRDLGDPDATEFGAGHAGGNGSPYDDGLYHSAPGNCPAASTMGTVEAITPLLPEPLHGQIFLGTPDCSPCSNADAEAGKLLKLYLEINDPVTGTILKLPGTVAANATTGRLTASFKENPQLPFSDLKLHFKTGPRAALVTPQTCGSYQVNSSLEPWSAPETPTAVSNSEFKLTTGPNGAPCGPQPNKPKFEAGTTFTQAGAYSPFVLKVSREDGSQRLKALNVTLPPGLIGKLAGVQECSTAAITAAEGTGGRVEQASPSCPLASELGTVNVGAGAGPTPYYVQGHAYLGGPYKGAPLSMAIITPAVAGPFDLGTVVVRAALFVDETTAQITVKSDPIPQIVSGIPLDVRSIAVNISRNQFTLNPTSCDPMTLAASVIADASEAPVSNPFQVGGCSSLGFKPKLSLSLNGGTKRNRHPALKSVITYPSKGAYANIARAAVTLPASEFIDQAHIGNPCIRPDFAAGKCPKISVLGRAKAWSPLLDKPLEGKVYFRSNGGERELPDLVVALKGQIPLTLVGFVDAVHHKGSEVSRLRTTFATVPDAPVSRFILELKGGKEGLLVNSGNLCKIPNKAVVKLTAQNGKVYDTNPPVANSCGKGKKSRRGTSHR